MTEKHNGNGKPWWVKLAENAAPSTVITAMFVAILWWISTEYAHFMRQIDERTKRIEKNQVRILDKLLPEVQRMTED